MARKRPLKTIDISNLPEWQRIVEEVRRTNQPVILQQDSQDVAVVEPLKPTPPAKKVVAQTTGMLKGSGPRLTVEEERAATEEAIAEEAEQRTTK